MLSEDLWHILLPELMFDESKPAGNRLLAVRMTVKNKANQ